MNLAKLALEKSEPLPAFVQKRVIQPCGGTKTNAKTILKLELNFIVCINKLYIKVYMVRLKII